jgi:hypothetical protein
MWCIWREINYWSFEDSERMVAELKALFFYFLFQSYDCFHISSFHDFFDLFSFFYSLMFLFYTLCTWVFPLFLMKLFTYKKEVYDFS